MTPGLGPLLVALWWTGRGTRCTSPAQPPQKMQWKRRFEQSLSYHWKDIRITVYIWQPFEARIFQSNMMEWNWFLYGRVWPLSYLSLNLSEHWIWTSVMFSEFCHRRSLISDHTSHFYQVLTGIWVFSLNTQYCDQVLEEEEYKFVAVWSRALKAGLPHRFFYPPSPPNFALVLDIRELGCILKRKIWIPVPSLTVFCSEFLLGSWI